MGRGLGLAVAVAMVVVGALWTFQGLGYVGDSFMTDSETWAIIGSVVAGLGVALAFTVVRGSRRG